jgi:uncharacterized integral membrane protein (TIGR00698 family)
MVIGPRRMLSGVLPGLALLVAVGLSARAITIAIPALNHLIVAVILGAVIVNVTGIPAWAEAGVGTHHLLLEAGIVLMGALVSLEALSMAGPIVAGLVVATVVFTLGVTELLARRLFGVTGRMSSMLASGAAICGVSAVVAVAGGIGARRDQIALAVGAVLVLDALTLFMYPIVGGMLGLPEVVFGIWAGLSMFSTGPVAAAGFAYSETSGQWATITKLTRNLLIGAAVVGYAAVYTTHTQAHAWGISRTLRTFWGNFPKFVLGFIAMVAVANSGLIPMAQVASLQNAYRWLFLFAFAGLGMSLNPQALRSTGLRPLAVVVTALVTVSTVSLGVLLLIFP